MMTFVVHRAKVTLHPVHGGLEAWPVAEYIHDPDLTGLFDPEAMAFLAPYKHWKISGDAVTEMDTAEKASADAAELVERKAITTQWCQDAAARNTGDLPDVLAAVDTAPDIATVDAAARAWLAP